MGTKLELGTFTAGFNSATRLQAIVDAIEAELDLCLYRDGTSPNTMLADLDMNDNDILNAGNVDATDVTIAGVSLATQVAAAAASATAASSSATAAATSATSAASAFDSFDDRYLGAKSSDPSVDNDGDALVTGALYFNTTTDTMKVWNGSSWGNLSIPTNFTDLSDVDSDYTGDGLKFLRVKATEDGIEFAATSGSEPSDGDKGDIVVSGSGTVWTIEDSVAVTGWNLTTPTITTSVTFDGSTITGLTGADLSIVTGTPGTAGNLAMWNADGDVVDSTYAPIDEDSMATNSATRLPSQQSVKAYVDAQIATIPGTGTGAAAQMAVAVNSTLTAVGLIPYDNTIPQITEGTEIVTVSITPTASDSTILIEGVVQIAMSNNGTYATAAVFVDATTNAIGATAHESDGSMSAFTFPFMFTHAPGDTSAHTYRLRVGRSSGTADVNAASGSANIFSTAGPVCTIKVTEILA